MRLIDLSPLFLSIILGIFGLLLGSFANVLIHRLPQEDPKDRDIALKPSHCPQCKARIRWYHNIPLLSFLALGGRCADCGCRIPFRYPLVEALSCLIFALSPWFFPFGTLIWIKALICAYALLVLFFTDFTEFILPDHIQFPLMVLGILFALPQIFWPEHLTQVQATATQIQIAETFGNGLQMAPLWTPYTTQMVTWQNSLIGLALGYGLPWLVNGIYRLIRKQDGLGMGDFKMLAWLGAFWGWAPMLGILFLASFLAVIFALPLLLTGRAKSQTMLPLGCFLALATFPIVFYGSTLWIAYLSWMN